MKLYLDTEFIEDGRTIDLVSIALVSESGQEFYRQNSQADFGSANDFVIENVIPRLWPCPKGMTGRQHVYGLCPDKTCVWRPKRLIRDELFQFVGLLSKPDGFTWEKPEFWAYYADYDWVALCQLFGRMGALPTGWPMYCRDIKQYADYLGNPTMPKGTEEHNALSDARWNLAAHRYLQLYDLSLSRYEREGILAGQRNEQRVPSREVHQESGAVRGVETPGNGQEHGGGDLELQPQEDRQEIGEVVITEADYKKALNAEVRYPDGQESSPIQ